MTHKDMAEEPKREKSRYITAQEEYEQRCRRRITEELGVNPADVEIILHLRRQVVSLQNQIRELQAELEYSQGSRMERVSVYRRETIEAIWYDDQEIPQDEE
jgi:hypothetical protein